jgi:hypothetical protein
MLVIKTINNRYYTTKEYFLYAIIKGTKDIDPDNEVETVEEYITAAFVGTVFIAAVHKTVTKPHNIDEAVIHPIAAVVEFYQQCY